MQLRSVILTACLFALPLSGQAKLYKWIDAQGRVHYSDNVPPEAAGHEREVKSDQGVTLDHFEAAKSREQLEAERRARAEALARQQAAEAAAAKQAEQDRILLMTFSSALEIERARDDRLAAVNGQIRLTETRLTKLRGQLEQARQQAANAERSGRQADAIHQRIETLETQIAGFETFIEDKRAEHAAIATRFDADLARYRELKAGQRGEASSSL